MKADSSSRDGAFDRQKSWSSRSLGSKRKHAFFYVLLRFLGLSPAKFILFFVVLSCCLNPSVYGRGRHYLSRRFRGDKFPARFCRVFKLYWSFACMLLERAAAGVSGTPIKVAASGDCIAGIREALDEKRGLIILSAHTGAWQIALAGLDFGVRVNIMQPRGSGDVDRHIFEHGENGQAASAGSGFNIIDPGRGFGGFIDAREALKRGEIVCIMGDRLMPGEKLVAKTDFLGEKAVFPCSAYMLASITGAPVQVILSRRTGVCRVECACAALFRIPRHAGKAQRSFEQHAALYASILQRFAMANPYQFFNFHDIWI